MMDISQFGDVEAQQTIQMSKSSIRLLDRFQTERLRFHKVWEHFRVVWNVFDLFFVLYNIGLRA